MRITIPPILGLLLLGAALLFAACDQAHPALGINDAELDTAASRPAAPGSIIPGSLAFRSTRDHPTGDIYVMNPGGQNVRRLTMHAAINMQPDWSPAGQHIVFTSNRAGQFNLWILDVAEPEHMDGTGNVVHTAERITDTAAPRLDAAGVWSPDGSRIAYHSTRHALPGDATFEIYSVDMHSHARPRPVTRLTTDAAMSMFPAWSPDGSRLAFARGNGSPVPTTIHIMNADGSNPQSLVNLQTGQIFRLRWSPDGRHLVFTGLNITLEGQVVPYWTVYVVDADGNNLRNLTPIPPGVLPADWDNRPATWGNNSNHVYFSSLRPGTNDTFQAFRINRDGSGLKQLTSPPGDSGQPGVRPVTRP
jgi:Tol biopolymer transport system component